MSDYRNHSMNSLRSNSISCRFACLAYATQESKKIPIIVQPLKTSSCGMFSRLLYFPLVTYMPRYFYLSPFSRGGDSRDVKKLWRTLKGDPSGQRLESHTKILMEGGLCPESTTSPCQRLARGLGSGSRPLLMKRGSGVMEVPRVNPRMGSGMIILYVRGGLSL